MAFVVVALTVFVLPFIPGTGSWITARILLPQTGLAVPDWSAFYWANVVLVILGGVL
jgi:hypothetical protein